VALICAVIVGYAPFYFDGNYPGGGARLWIDAIAFEQILVAWIAVRLGAARFVVPLALFGFAFHASFDHRLLAEREGGRPMFEPSVLERAGIRSGIVFVDTDHGFNLGHVPGSATLVVARRRGDAHDWLLWQALGRPAAFRYEYEPGSSPAAGAVSAYRVPRSARWEAEAEWPPLSVRGGWVQPVFSGCASGGRGIELIALGGRAVATLSLSVQDAGPHAIRVGWLGGARPPRLRVNGHPLAVTPPAVTPPAPLPCASAGVGAVWLASGPASLDFETDGASRLDYVELAPTRARPPEDEGAPKRR
jgi:hypothetical protein